MQQPRYTSLWQPALVVLLLLALTPRPAAAAFMAWECAGVVSPPTTTSIDSTAPPDGAIQPASVPSPEPASMVSAVVGSALALAVWRRKRRPGNRELQEEEVEVDGIA